jgi:hypothetical protein
MNTQMLHIPKGYKSLEELGVTSLPETNVIIQNISGVNILVTIQDEPPEPDSDVPGFVIRSYEHVVYNVSDGDLYLSAVGDNNNVARAVIG